MEPRVRSFKLILILLFFVFFLIFVLLQFLAPLYLPSGSVDDLSGLVGVYDNEETIINIPSPWNSVYSIGDRMCHQIADRSFFINGNQMPFCARCTGIFLGVTIGFFLMIFLKIQLDKKFIYLIILGILPIGVDGLGQLIDLWESTNLTRVLTGLLIGIITGIAIVIIIDELEELIKRKSRTKSKYL